MVPLLRPVLLLAACVLLAGCSGAGGGPPPDVDPAPSPEAVAWADAVCGALVPFVDAAGRSPQLDPAADPAALVRGVSGYLERTQVAVESAIGGMAAAGPSPVAGGDEVVRRLTASLTAFRTSFQDARARLDAVDPADRRSLAGQLPAAIAPLQQLVDLPKATAGLPASPELARASGAAARCREVGGLVPGAAAPPP
jgi:hypothetical protein